MLDLARLHRPALLLLHLPFADREAAAQQHADAGALAVLKVLRWCPGHLDAARAMGTATGAASCWGRGVLLDDS